MTKELATGRNLFKWLTKEEWAHLRQSIIQQSTVDKEELLDKTTRDKNNTRYDQHKKKQSNSAYVRTTCHRPRQVAST